MNENEKKVLAVLAAYKSAVYAKDVEAFVSLYDEKIHVFDMWEKWSYEGIAAWRTMATEWFGSLGSERVVVDMDDVKTIVTSELAFASAYFKFTAVSESGETLRWLENRFSCVMKPVGDRWVIVEEHTSGPANPETLKIALRR